MAKKKTFETTLAELESIVKEMESGELNLEDTAKKYEQGMKLSKTCLDFLEKTESKIQRITSHLDGGSENDNPGGTVNDV
ncbi:MAG: exodeoxyribonuclease VII small subunit [Desulfobacteraceae bacterium]|nr:MAG: exodeoxyribonuclease VII small subunit [Desulfobacteraceae bacterium]